MRQRSDPPIRPSEITPREIYFSRREVLRSLGIGAAGAALGGLAMPALARTKLQTRRNVRYSTAETANSFEDITTYNNYYEFGTGKDDPAANAGAFRTDPWAVTVSGEAEVTGRFTLESIVRPHA